MDRRRLIVPAIALALLFGGILSSLLDPGDRSTPLMLEGAFVGVTVGARIERWRAARALRADS